MSCPPDDDGLPSHTSTPPPTLNIDWELYAAMLEDSDMPLDQQKELVETLWTIVVMFVDLGFDLHPTRQICGETGDSLSDDPSDLLSLIRTEWEQTHKEDTWQDQ
ncbi:hypothetical protein DS901_09025 [Loktanella sp. D2R18]|nr:hypothetical protein DS901_09025 [Loktanella sp. D2R18]